MTDHVVEHKYLFYSKWGETPTRVWIQTDPGDASRAAGLLLTVGMAEVFLTVGEAELLAESLVAVKSAVQA